MVCPARAYHNGGVNENFTLGDTGNKQAVRILLECILMFEVNLSLITDQDI